MAVRPIVVVSNRGPTTFVDGPDGPTPGPPAGGLARGLRPLVEESGGTWVACAVSPGDRAAVALERPDPDLDLRLIAIDQGVYSSAYDTVANGTLWFLHHGLWDLPRRPRFDHTWVTAWRAYREYNSALAAEVAASAPDGAVVLVQDYHLALLAVAGHQPLAEQRPDLDLIHFSHTPWCGPEWLSTLPTETAREYLQGMATFSACGFHTDRWRRRFEQCCDELGVAPPTTFASPLPPDGSGISAVASSPDCEQRLAELNERLGDERLIVMSGRLELSKNIQRGLFAFEELLVRRPDLRGEVTLGAFVYPSREGIIDYQSYRQECEGTAARINARFGSAEWRPVLFDTEDDLARSVAGLRRADVLLINPVRDGLNLVAFEGPLVNERSAALVISAEAGAASLLADAATVINPFDIDETAVALASALDRSVEQRATDASTLREIASARAIDEWLADQLTALG